MRRIITIILLLISFNCLSQTSINNINLDTLGHLKWNVTFLTPELRLEIQKNVMGKWTTIFETGYGEAYIRLAGTENDPITPISMTTSDSCVVPLDKGTNNFRILMTIPAKLESKEVSVKLFSNNKHYLYNTKDNYIRFEDKVAFSMRDSNGKLIRTFDVGRMINVTDLKKGLYYIIINRDIYEFEKK